MGRDLWPKVFLGPFHDTAALGKFQRKVPPLAANASAERATGGNSRNPVPGINALTRNCATP
jgi:hypothetical protein